MPRKTDAIRRVGAAGGLASMRPRPDAAENFAPPATRPAGATGFNEAAARCRGKLTRAATTWSPRPALQ